MKINVDLNVSGGLLRSCLCEIANSIDAKKQYRFRLEEASEEANADGWINWAGGECPVDPEAVVSVMFRNGQVENGIGSYWAWVHQDLIFDIIACRVIPKIDTQARDVAHTEPAYRHDVGGAEA